MDLKKEIIIKIDKEEKKIMIEEIGEMVVER